MSTKKEKCKEIMIKLFGPSTGAQVDNMTEEECIDKCKDKVKRFFGEEKVKIFDTI